MMSQSTGRLPFYPPCTQPQCKAKQPDHHHHHHHQHHPVRRHHHHHPQTKQQQRRQVDLNQHQQQCQKRKECQTRQLRRHHSYHDAAHLRMINQHRSQQIHQPKQQPKKQPKQHHCHHHQRNHHTHHHRAPKRSQRIANKFLRPRAASSPPLSRSKDMTANVNPVLHVHAHGTIKRMPDGVTYRGAYGVICPTHFVGISEPLAGSLHTTHRASLAALHSALELVHGLRSKRAIVHISDGKLATHFHSKLDAWAAAGWHTVPETDEEDENDIIDEEALYRLEEEFDDEFEDDLGDGEVMSMMTGVSGLTAQGGTSSARGGRVRRDRRAWAAVLSLRNALHAKGAVISVKKSRPYTKEARSVRRLARAAALKKHIQCTNCGSWVPEGYVHNCSQENIRRFKLAKQQQHVNKSKIQECWRDKCMGKKFKSIEEYKKHIYKKHALKCGYPDCDFATLDTVSLTRHNQQNHFDRRHHHHHQPGKHNIAILKKKRKKNMKKESNFITCQFCKTRLNSRYELREHIRKNCKQPPTCDCGKKFISYDELNAHLQRDKARAVGRAAIASSNRNSVLGASAHAHSNKHRHKQGQGHKNERRKSGHHSERTIIRHPSSSRSRSVSRSVSRPRSRTRSRSGSRSRIFYSSDTDSTYSTSSSSRSSSVSSMSSSYSSESEEMTINDDRLSLSNAAREFRGLPPREVNHGGGGDTKLNGQTERMGARERLMMPGREIFGERQRRQAGENEGASAFERRDRLSE